MQSSTNILIAQRVSSVIDADDILILENGRIVSRGTHEELMQRSEIYRDIRQSQLKGEETSHV
ncbi:Multidrug resistance ABC transporter ATP-binding/permease protein BmrA [compost metagenome]